MNKYVTGAFIKKLREEKKMTQHQLAEKIFVSEKTISKWETGKGYPDITLLETLAKALDISVIELMSGNDITNANRSFNMKNVKFYVCPICGNIVFSTGEAVVCCCGVSLIPLEAEDCDSEHRLTVEPVEDEYYAFSSHEMSKYHHISFIAIVNDNSCEIIKLYPEGSCEARFKISGARKVYFYCNHHGLFESDIR
ncbi:MAG: helix-turn-helix domain-containing protein [Eubacterium sp.]